MKKIFIFLLFTSSIACIEKKEESIIGNWITADIGEYGNNSFYGGILTIDSNHVILKAIGKPSDTMKISIDSAAIRIDTISLDYQSDNNEIIIHYDSLNQVRYKKMIPSEIHDVDEVVRVLQSSQWKFTANDIEHQITFLDTALDKSLIRTEFMNNINTCHLRIKYEPKVFTEIESTYYTVENYKGQTFLRIENVFDHQFTWLMMLQDISKRNIQTVFWQENKLHKVNLKKI